MPLLLRSLLWSGLDTLGTVGIGLASIIVVARIVGPTEFGLGALAIGVTLLIMLPTTSLVHDAIVQRPTTTSLELDSAFALSILTASIASTIAALAAVPLAAAMDEPRLARIVWALLPTVVFSAAAAPLVAERRRAMDFGNVSRKQLATRAAGLTAAVAVALAGGGVWAVVTQQLVTSGSLACALLLTTPRRLQLRLSFRAAAPLIAFSRYIIGTQLLLQVSDRVFLFAIGYVGGVSAAGFWGAGSRIVESLTGIVNATSYHVALAHFSRLQQDRAQIGRALTTGHGLLMLCVVPAITALAGSIDPLMRLLMGMDWLPVGDFVPWMLLGALVSAHILIPAVALTALGQPHANLAATAATGGAALASLLLAGGLGTTVIAAIRGLAPLAGWFVLARHAASELRDRVLRQAGDLGIDLIAVALGLGLAHAATPTIAAWTLAAQAVAQASLAGTMSALVLALARPRVARVVLDQLRWRRPSAWSPAAPPLPRDAG